MAGHRLGPGSGDAAVLVRVVPGGLIGGGEQVFPGEIQQPPVYGLLLRLAQRFLGADQPLSVRRPCGVLPPSAVVFARLPLLRHLEEGAGLQPPLFLRRVPGQPLGHQDRSHVLSGRYPAQESVVASEGAGVPTADARCYLQVVGVDEESVVPTILSERFDRLLQAPPMLGETGRYPVAQVGRDGHHHQATRLGDAVGPVGFGHIRLIVRVGPVGARVNGPIESNRARGLPA